MSRDTMVGFVLNNIEGIRSSRKQRKLAKRFPTLTSVLDIEPDQLIPYTHKTPSIESTELIPPGLYESTKDDGIVHSEDNLYVLWIQIELHRLYWRYPEIRQGVDEYADLSETLQEEYPNHGSLASAVMHDDESISAEIEDAMWKSFCCETLGSFFANPPKP